MTDINVNINVASIKFKDGNEFTINKEDLILVVGPNNSGKTLCLNEIQSLIQTRNSAARNLIVEDVTTSKEDSTEQLIDKLVNRSQLIITSIETSSSVSKYRVVSHRSKIEQFWEEGQGLGHLSTLLVNLLSTSERLNSVEPPLSIKLTSDAFVHPIHFLQRDEKLEEKFSTYFNQAFGKDIIINRGAGREVPIHVGAKPVLGEGEDRVSLNYIKELEKLPLLHKQGDGMKSFIGVLLNTFVSEYSIVLIDEPEAFLHPPQAKLLGRMLGKDLPRDRQLILATHSGDFLRGILDSNNQNVRIIRIDRNENSNVICELKPSQIMNIWSDPILRYSNILDGIFHTKVILCESDSDCRFYSAILEAYIEKENLPNQDIMFIHCGGKHRMPKIIKALKELQVPLEVICDFDILNDVDPIKLIVNDLGGDWSSVKDKWKIVKETIDKKRPELETAGVKSEINEVLDQVTESIFPKASVKKIGKILKKTSAWSQAKQVGKVFIPSGDATNFYNELITYFKSINFHIVEVGELESFCKSVGNHGPKWVNEVLIKDLKNDPELEPARNFVATLI